MTARCTNDVRSVSRLENEVALDRMAERLKKAPEEEAGDSRSSPRGRRASLRQHQAVDGSGRFLDARPRQRARRVQPDGASLLRAH